MLNWRHVIACSKKVRIGSKNAFLAGGYSLVWHFTLESERVRCLVRLASSPADISASPLERVREESLVGRDVGSTVSCTELDLITWILLAMGRDVGCAIPEGEPSMYHVVSTGLDACKAARCCS